MSILAVRADVWAIWIEIDKLNVEIGYVNNLTIGMIMKHGK